MQVDDNAELKRRFDSVVTGLKIRPYPAPQAMANNYEIATIEYSEARALKGWRCGICIG
jgi:hypothetical protein